MTVQQIWDRFAQVYREKYGYFYDDVGAEVVNLRVSGMVLGHTVDLTPLEATGETTRTAIKGERPAFSGFLQEMVRHTVFNRYGMSPGYALEGPAIIEEKESTTVVDVRRLCRGRPVRKPCHYGSGETVTFSIIGRCPRISPPLKKMESYREGRLS